MSLLGNGLSNAGRHADALSVREADLATMRRLGAPEEALLVVQGNLASTYEELGRLDEGMRLRQDTYSGWLKLKGDAHEQTLREATSCATTLSKLQRYAEAKAMLLKRIPVARRVLGESHENTLLMRKIYAWALYKDDGATLENVREAVATIEDTERIARRVLGGAHPTTTGIEQELRNARAALRARETPELLAQDAFRTARAKLAQERAELAQTLAAASARPSSEDPA